MKTNFDKYISSQIQDIEDNLKIDHWDEFQTYFAKHKRVKVMRFMIPAVAAASIIIASVFSGLNNIDNGLNDTRDESGSIADNNPIIITKIPVCRNELKPLHRPHKVTVTDTLSVSDTQQRKDTVSTRDREATSYTPATEKDTTSSPAVSYSCFKTENVTANVPKKNLPTFSIGLSGGPGVTSRESSLIQFNAPGNGSLSGTMEKVSYKHMPPMTLGVSVGMNFNKRFVFITGLNYSFYLSHKEIKSTDKVKYEKQQLHYLGLPVRCNYTIYSDYSDKPFEWYAGGGLQVEKCLSAKSGTTTLQERNFLWSAVLTTGIQYNITQNLSIYCEPYFSYLLSRTELFSYRSDNSVEISASLGIRLALF